MQTNALLFIIKINKINMNVISYVDLMTIHLKYLNNFKN